MNGYWIGILAFAPGLFWLWYFYKKDELEPEPKALVWRMFFYGMLLVIPCGLIENILPLSPFTMLIFAAPVIEECAKFFLVRTTIYRYAEFDEPMDGIVYAAATALGFASLENLGYLISHQSSVLTIGDESVYGGTLGLSLSRALLSVPGHVLFSAAWGFALGITKFMDESSKGWIYVRAGLVISIISHGLFNFLCMAPWGAFLLLIFMYSSGRMVKKQILTALMNSPHAPYDLKD